MTNKNIFCGRKGGAHINNKFYPIRTSDILAKELERRNNKMETRIEKRNARR